MENKINVSKEVSPSPLLQEYLNQVKKEFEESEASKDEASKDEASKDESSKDESSKDETQRDEEQEEVKKGSGDADKEEEESGIEDEIAKALGLKGKDEDLFEISEEELENMDKEKVKELYKKVKEVEFKDRVRTETELIEKNLSKIPDKYKSKVEETLISLINSDLYESLERLTPEKRIATLFATCLGTLNIPQEVEKGKKENVKKIVKEVDVDNKEGSEEEGKLIELARKGDKRALKRLWEIRGIADNYLK